MPRPFGRTPAAPVEVRTTAPRRSPFCGGTHVWTRPRTRARPVSVLTAPCPLCDIEARHPALRGAKSPMQTLRIKPPSSGKDGRSGRDRGGSCPPARGRGSRRRVVGAVLALSDAGTPLRGPFTLFFLLAAPARAVGAAPRGARTLAPHGGVRRGSDRDRPAGCPRHVAVHRWSVRGGIVAVTVISLPALLLVVVRRQLRHAARKQA
jgi:hypothetical protein